MIAFEHFDCIFYADFRHDNLGLSLPITPRFELSTKTRQRRNARIPCSFGCTATYSAARLTVDKVPGCNCRRDRSDFDDLSEDALSPK